jgi:hypothetical protein
MLIELAIYAFVATFVAIVVLGHVLFAGGQRAADTNSHQ